MIPDDAKQRKEAELDKTLKAQQTILGDHFGLADEVIPYSEKAFEALAIEWLVYTNQVLSFLCYVSLSVLTVCCTSQSTHSSISASRRCLIWLPGQAAASHYPLPRKHAHASSTCSSSKCSYSVVVLT